MNPFIALQARLKARSDSEHEQAILRITIFAMVLAYMGIVLGWSSANPNFGSAPLLLLQGLAIALAAALAIFVAICLSPAASRIRRLIGMVVDVGAATFCMFLAGEAGVVMIGVYLFVIFGNGFRYGSAYLMVCQLLCLAGFAAVLMLAPYWQSHQVTGWGLMVSLLVVPLYVSTLLRRIQAAHATTEEALRSRNERYRKTEGSCLSARLWEREE